MLRYQKVNPEEIFVWSGDAILGSIKRENPPPGVPHPWVYRFWPKGVTSKTQATSAFPSLDLIKKKLEAG